MRAARAGLQGSSRVRTIQAAAATFVVLTSVGVGYNLGKATGRAEAVEIARDKATVVTWAAPNEQGTYQWAQTGELHAWPAVRIRR